MGAPQAPSLIRQHFAPGFYCEGNNQQSDPKSNRGERHRLAESSHVSDQRADPEVDPGGNESSERSSERKRSRTHRGSVLFRQPESEDGEVAAKEAQKEQHRDERMESVRQVKRPSETKQDADRHPEKVEGQGALTAKALGQWRDRQAAKDGSQRQQSHAKGRHAHGLRLQHPSTFRQADDRRSEEHTS